MARPTLAVLLLCAAACSHPAPEPAPAPAPAPEPAPPVVVRVTDTITVRDPELPQQVSRLELRVAERDARIAELESRLEAAQQEVVRTMARSQGNTSRAEAASAIAEAGLATQAPRGASAADVAQARRMLKLGNEAFGEGNYSGAFYLANQAKVIVAPSRRVPGGERPAQPGEKAFASPVRLKASQRANVREGPGPAFKVLFTVETGAALTGYSYTDAWVRVADEAGRAGWVSRPLVSGK